MAADLSVLHAGDLPRFDEDGTNLGSFAPREVTAGIGLARRIGDRVSIGAVGRVLRLDGGAASASACAFDAGMQLDLSGLRLGVCARNVGASVRTGGADYELPAELAAGLTREWRFGTCATLSFTAPAAGGGAVIGVGGDVLRVGPMALLCGATYDPKVLDGGLSGSVGIEMEVGAVRAAYAYATRAQDLSSHHLSVCVTALGRSPRVERSEGDGERQCRYAVWGAIHRTASGAEVEARAYGVEGLTGATVVRLADGRFRVRLARDLDRETAEDLVSRYRGTSITE